MLRYGRPHAGAQPAGHHDRREVGAGGHGLDGWGARIRTWDPGTKPRCLTTWLRPTNPFVPQLFFADVPDFGFSPRIRINAITAKTPARMSASGPMIFATTTRMTVKHCDAAAIQAICRPVSELRFLPAKTEKAMIGIEIAITVQREMSFGTARKIPSTTAIPRASFSGLA